MSIISRPKILIVCVLAITIVATGVIFAFEHMYGPKKAGTTQALSADSGPSTLVSPATLALYPKKSNSSADTSRIENGIIPPTNSWMSGMVLQPTPLPVYPMPLSFLAKTNGFELGTPTITASATIVTGEHGPGITVALASATDFRLTRYDKISATLRYVAGPTTLGTMTLAEGSPYVFYKAAVPSTMTLSSIGTMKSHTSTYVLYDLAGHSYGVSCASGAQLSLSGSSATITVPQNGMVSFYGLPTGQSDSLHAYAANQITSVTTTSSQVNGLSRTTLTYNTANSKPTVIAPMSYSTVVNPGPSAGSYDSIYGPMETVIGNHITLSSPITPSADTLDVSHLTQAHKNEVIDSLATDVKNTSFTAKDSYYSGKELGRAANLLMLSEQLGQTGQSKVLITLLTQAFASRLGPDFFYYDPTLRGMAAQTSSFGSEDFNDHHFHYGYFIYAASILGKYDPSFVRTYQSKINVLVADIASYSGSSDFPYDRYYDPYAQHSWAAGLAPFADGNNQESSSEALNAWNAVALWAALTNNARLHDNANWMLANEAATAKSSWRSFSHSADYLKNYTSPLSPLNFGGKRTYSTFFSDAPSAKLGIQLIPMSPAMMAFISDGNHIADVVNDSITGNNFNVALGDYILMYYALSHPQQAADLLAAQQPAFIDDGNSKTYLEAWVYSLTDH